MLCYMHALLSLEVMLLCDRRALKCFVIVSDLEKPQFPSYIKCGINYWKKVRSKGPTHMGSASLRGNGHASVSGRGEGVWVCKEVTLPDWLVVLLWKLAKCQS